MTISQLVTNGQLDKNLATPILPKSQIHPGQQSNLVNQKKTEK